MKIISQRKNGVSVSYARVFQYVNCPGAGASFPCTKDGKISTLMPAGVANLQNCLKGGDPTNPIIDLGIQEESRRYTVAAVGECDVCEKHVELEGFTNTCSCGADYNSFGQRLADRSQWGEETGETADDILGY
jgi:hypothetical protein